MTCSNICSPDYTTDKIVDILNQVDYEIWLTARANVFDLYFGYKNKADFSDKVTNLSLLKYILNKKLDSIKYEYAFCLCDCKLQRIIEKYSKLFSKKSNFNKSISTDKSNLEEWTLYNPKCVAKERWEDCMCNYIQYLGLDITVEKKINELLYDIKVTPVLKDILLDIKVAKQNKEILFDKIVQEKKYKLEFDTLIQDRTNKITFDQYYSLRNSGITYDIITRCTANNISFNVISTEGQHSQHICTRTCNYPLP